MHSFLYHIPKLRFWYYFFTGEIVSLHLYKKRNNTLQKSVTYSYIQSMKIVRTNSIEYSNGMMSDMCRPTTDFTFSIGCEYIFRCQLQVPFLLSLVEENSYMCAWNNASIAFPDIAGWACCGQKNIPLFFRAAAEQNSRSHIKDSKVCRYCSPRPFHSTVAAHLPLH